MESIYPIDQTITNLQRWNQEFIRNFTQRIMAMEIRNDIKIAESQQKTEKQRRSHEKKLEDLEIRFEEQRRSHKKKLEELEIRFEESRLKTKAKYTELDIKVKESELRVNEMSLHTNHIYNQNMEINQLLNMNKNRPQSVPSGPLQPAPESPDLIPNVRAPNSSGYLGDQSRDEVHSKEKEELP